MIAKLLEDTNGNVSCGKRGFVQCYGVSVKITHTHTKKEKRAFVISVKWDTGVVLVRERPQLCTCVWLKRHFSTPQLMIDLLEKYHSYRRDEGRVVSSLPKTEVSLNSTLKLDACKIWWHVSVLLMMNYSIGLFCINFKATGILCKTLLSILLPWHSIIHFSIIIKFDWAVNVINYNSKIWIPIEGPKIFMLTWLMPFVRLILWQFIILSLLFGKYLLSRTSLLFWNILKVNELFSFMSIS